MNAYDKGILLKDAIIQLYSNEGRSKSYISSLLKIDRTTLRKLINEWQLVQGNPNKDKLNDFIAANRDKILSMITSGSNQNAICSELHIGHEYFRRILLTDKEINDAYRFRTLQGRMNTEYIEGEQWKPILGYENYEISDHGRIRKANGFITTQINCKSGYETVNLSKDGTAKGFRVHRLVAHAFCPGYSDIRNTVNHIDGDISNNKASNLEWVSQSDNNQHAYDKLNRVHTHGAPPKYTIIYQNKYTFKTIAAFAKFINKSETQAARWLKEPEQHDIRLVSKS